jgi:hypothetical protein
VLPGYAFPAMVLCPGKSVVNDLQHAGKHAGGPLACSERAQRTFNMPVTSHMGGITYLP